jgi:hypothetical protein
MALFKIILQENKCATYILGEKIPLSIFGQKSTFLAFSQKQPFTFFEFFS